VIIPTAEEFLQNSNKTTFNAIEETMIEFAKIHVAAALNEAANEADVEAVDADMYGVIWCVDVNTILNAYPLTNIK
jgi:hypothetical protein